MAPGQTTRYDYEYERHGVASVFMLTEPLRGWREVVVGDHRTAIDFAHVIKHLVDVHFSDVEQVVLVMDQLNIHTPGSLYEAFPPAEAKRLANTLEIHHTPKHGSWLNMAETELSVLTRQCLDRRIPDRHTLVDEVSAWNHDRNVNQSVPFFVSQVASARFRRLVPLRWSRASSSTCRGCACAPHRAEACARRVRCPSRCRCAAARAAAIASKWDSNLSLRTADGSSTARPTLSISSFISNGLATKPTKAAR
jgi:hypothetical protein